MKKKIIIIAIVAALLYLLYKRGTFDSLKEKSDDVINKITNSDPESAGKNDIDSLVDSLGMSSTLSTKCKKWANNIKIWYSQDDKWKKSFLIEKTKTYGTTNEQEYVCAALWQMYVTDTVITESQCCEYSKIVRS